MSYDSAEQCQPRLGLRGWVGALRYRSLKAYRSCAGGPREGRGGAVADARCSAFRGRNACSNDDGLRAGESVNVGDTTVKQSGQSSLACDGGLFPESVPDLTNLMPPEAEQISWTYSVSAIADVVDMPRNRANHANAKVANRFD